MHNLTKKVYIVKDKDIVPLKEQEHGQFFSEECYLIDVEYSISKNSSPIRSIYYWIGQDSHTTK